MELNEIFEDVLREEMNDDEKRDAYLDFFYEVVDFLEEMAKKYGRLFSWKEFKSIVTDEDQVISHVDVEDGTFLMELLLLSEKYVKVPLKNFY